MKNLLKIFFTTNWFRRLIDFILIDRSRSNNLVNIICSNINTSNLSSVAISTGLNYQYKQYIIQNWDIISEKIKILKYGMDLESQYQVDRYFNLYKTIPMINGDPQSTTLLYFIGMDLFTDEERLIILNHNNIINRLNQFYSHLDMSDIPINIHNMYFISGLKLIPYGFMSKINGTIALDCGAWVGDSTIPLVDYGFDKIYAFEPFPKSFKRLKINIQKNHLENICVPYQIGIDEKDGFVPFLYDFDTDHACKIVENSDQHVEVRSIDSFCSELENKNVSLIKMDIEGKELSALKGAINTIKKYKPILLLSAYHINDGVDQVFSLKEFIESLNLGYKFKFKWMQPEDGMLWEHMLICYCE
jgi:FkbM family methyltransferase